MIGLGLAVMTANGQEIKRLTTAPGDDDEPCFSPDGQWIVYQSRDRSGRPDLWIVAAGGGTPRRVTDGPGYNCFATWSPDGRRIVYASDPTGEYDLYALDRADGKWSAPRALTRTPQIKEYLPRFSPDGRQIAYNAALRTGYRLGDNGIFVMPVGPKATARQLVTSQHGAVAPAWSRDGTLIAFARSFIWANGHQLGVSMVPAAAKKTPDGKARPLKQLGGYPHYAPAFSPKADLLAFVMSKGEAWDLWVLPAPYTGQPVRLTRHPANDVNPAWSPDGKRIAFASNRSGNYDLYVMDVPAGVLAAAGGR